MINYRVFNINIRLLLLFFSLCMNSCVFMPPSAPDDLKFISVSEVSFNELSWKIKNAIGRYGSNQLPLYLLDVTFLSMDDIVEYRKNWANTRVTAMSCKDWDDRNKMNKNSSGGYEYAGPIRMGIPELFWKDINLSLDEMPAEVSDKLPPFYYHFYIDIRRKSEHQPHAEYDLRNQPIDVCFQIHSAEFMRPGAETNVVVIPKEAIASALNVR